MDGLARDKFVTKSPLRHPGDPAGHAEAFEDAEALRALGVCGVTGGAGIMRLVAMLTLLQEVRGARLPGNRLKVGAHPGQRPRSRHQAFIRKEASFNLAYFGDHRPASSAVGVESLFFPGQLIETSFIIDTRLPA